MIGDEGAAFISDVPPVGLDGLASWLAARGATDVCVVARLPVAVLVFPLGRESDRENFSVAGLKELLIDGAVVADRLMNQEDNQE